MPIRQSTLEARIKATEKSMLEQGLEALVVYALGSTLGPATRTHGHIRYLCDWDGHQNPSVLLLRPGKEPTLLVSNIFATFYTRQYFWIKDVRFFKPADLGQQAARVITSEGGKPSHLGIVGRNEIPVPVWETMAAGLPNTAWVDFTSTLDQMRIVKTPEQLAVHEEAARVCDMMFETLRKEIKQPRPGFQLQAEMERMARYSGAEYCMSLASPSGRRQDYSSLFHAGAARMPQPS